MSLKKSPDNEIRLTTYRVAVVIPVFNEARFIGTVLAGIPGWVKWIVIVDDGSTDESRDIIQSVSDPRIRYVAHDSNRGAGAAVVTGYRKALSLGSTVVAVMGGDGQMDPSDLSRVVTPAAEGWADYVKGNRFLYRKRSGRTGAGDPKTCRIPFTRRVGIGFFTLLTRLAAGRNDFGDSQCGFTAARRQLLECLDLDALPPRYGFPNDMILNVCRAGLTMVDIPVRPIYGDEQSGINPWRDLPGIACRILASIRLSRKRSGNTGRVVMLTTSFPRYSGDHAGAFVAALAAEMARTLPVTVIAPDYPGAVWAPSGVSIRRFRWAGWDGDRSLAYRHGIIENITEHPCTAMRQIPGFLLAMRRAAAAEIHSGDAIVSHWLIPGSWTASMVLPVKPGNRHIAIAHGSDVTLLEKMPEIIRRNLLSRIMTHTGTVICVSENLARRLEKLVPDVFRTPLTVLPMPFDSTQFEGVRNRKIKRCRLSSTGTQNSGYRAFQVLFMGRLIPVKGVETLFSALLHSPELQKKCTVHIAGDGPLRVHLETTARSAGLPVVFHGHVTGLQKEDLLAQCDAGVIPSIVTAGGGQEGTPAVLLEFMVCGLPVVATRSGGIPDLVTQDVNGLLAAPGDPVELAAGLEDLMMNPVKRTRLAEKAFETVENHSIARFVSVCFNKLKTTDSGTGII
jgi:dolichol-phosphate mannosyltransferase